VLCQDKVWPTPYIQRGPLSAACSKLSVSEFRCFILTVVIAAMPMTVLLSGMQHNVVW
jgi:hypothetical protein